MLNRIIRFSLSNRFLIVVAALTLVIAGFYQATRLPIDVLPDLNRPRVTIMTECPSLAPEEVESLVTMPLETALIGATGVESLRSSSVVGLSTIVAEFDWKSDLYLSRQIVFERLQRAASELPEGIVPQLTPVSSVMGQFLTLAIYSESGQTSAMDLRSIADWDVRRKLLSKKGVSEVFSMGGERRQYQVLLRPRDLLRFGVTVNDVEGALKKSNRNVTGGFLTEQGPKQFLVRSIGRIRSIDDLRNLIVKDSTEPAVVLHQVADIQEGASIAVGDSSAAVKLPDGTVFNGPAVVLTVEKQPNQDARTLTENILRETELLQEELREKYPDLTIVPLYQQRSYVELAVNNVLSALRDGALLVAIVVFLFLSSFRTTFVTLVTIPATLASTCFIFAFFGLSINTMTLGGLAVAIGELVDDAIVDVENIHRRLKENARLGSPLSTLDVVFGASSEIRNSVVNGTVITTLVFFPVFFLQGIEGKLFAPLGTAYVVSLTTSLLISLTLTPALSHWVLNGVFRKEKLTNQRKDAHKNETGVLLKGAQFLAEQAIKISLRYPGVVLSLAIGLGLVGLLSFFTLERDFMPPFNEGAIQVNLDLTPGTSLKTSSEIATNLAARLVQIDGIEAVVRKTGRSEMDEHAVPVNTTEFICSVDQTSGRSFNDIVSDVRETIDSKNIPGTLASYDQPLQHLLNHLRSGTNAKIAVKLNGDNLINLRRTSSEIRELLEGIEDVGSLRVDPIQADLPQVQIRLKRDALARFGLTPQDVDQTIAVALNGSIATIALEGERPVDVLTRLGNNYREDLDLLRRLPVLLPEKERDDAFETGTDVESSLNANTRFPSNNMLVSSLVNDKVSSRRGVVPLSELAEIDVQAFGPGQIDRENGRRQVVIQSNPRVRGAVEVKEDIETQLEPHKKEFASNGVDVRLSGLFESEASASQTLVALSCLSALAIFLLLFRMFRSANLALQVMSIVPLALVGSVVALTLTGQSRTIPSLIGMISLCGVASRNGILLLERYLRLVQNEGEDLTKEMILRAGRERVAPVLMTALTSIIGLLPLASAPNLPGREFLYPIATVMIGGLIASTVLEFFVRPALFWSFGLKAARRYCERDDSIEKLSKEAPCFKS
ncbi:MAG: efflux RND transporter permease subunit [Thermoguttaceae bacterium]|nr:efflux RND transporter permease subunit [Thermoguttaceae bacterium]